MRLAKKDNWILVSLYSLPTYGTSDSSEIVNLSMEDEYNEDQRYSF